MTGKDLLISLGRIHPKYYEEAEKDTPAAQQRGPSLRKPMLIAALVATMLLLVGCAVMYALRLQDMSIGTETYTQSFDDDGKYLEEPVEKTRDILTLYGHSGEPVQLAMKQWYDYLQTYDPEGAFLDNNPDHPEIPNQYEYTYGCYTPDMVAKVEEIAAQYNLKLLEEWIPFQAWQGEIFLRESGIGSFVRPDSGGEITRVSGMYYPPYNFDMDIELTVDKLDRKLLGGISYTRKDYLPNAVPGGMDLSRVEQWDITAPDGTPLLLALDNKGTAFILAEQENAMLIYHFDGNFSGSAYPAADEVLTKAQLESIAQVFDYTIQPQILDRTTVQAQLDAADEAQKAQHTYVPETYGSFDEALKNRIVMPNEKAQYALYDLTGDGVEDLLVDTHGYGAITEWYTMEDGEVQTDFGMSVFLCEGRVLESHFPDAGSGDYALHCYQKAIGDTALMDMDPDTEEECMTALQMIDGTWYQSKVPDTLERQEISSEEAKAVMAQYPRIQLDWKPLMEYPISETQTLRDYLEAKDVPVPPEQLRSIYAEDLEKTLQNLPYSHYRLLDINGDGVEDLLLKGPDDPYIGSTDAYWVARTYRYGRLLTMQTGDFYLCEDGVLEETVIRHDLEPGVEIIGHQFVRLHGMERELLEFVAYNKSTASWQGDWEGDVPMTEDQASAILASHPRMDQGMRPISELLG